MVSNDIRAIAAVSAKQPDRTSGPCGRASDNALSSLSQMASRYTIRGSAHVAESRPELRTEHDPRCPLSTSASSLKGETSPAVGRLLMRMFYPWSSIDTRPHGPGCAPFSVGQASPAGSNRPSREAWMDVCQGGFSGDPGLAHLLESPVLGMDCLPTSQHREELGEPLRAGLCSLRLTDPVGNRVSVLRSQDFPHRSRSGVGS